eukprot:g4868.t1
MCSLSRVKSQTNSCRLALDLKACSRPAWPGWTLEKVRSNISQGLTMHQSRCRLTPVFAPKRGALFLLCAGCQMQLPHLKIRLLFDDLNQWHRQSDWWSDSPIISLHATQSVLMRAHSATNGGSELPSSGATDGYVCL